MAFYDSVKDDIRAENGDEPDGSADEDDEDNDSMPFDHLKKGAEDEDDGDGGSDADTPIEVLTEDGIKPADEPEDTADSAAGSGGEAPSQPTQQPRQPQQDDASAAQEEETAGGTGASQARVEESAGGTQPSGVDASGDELVETLQRIEQQNSEMLDVLRGIKRSLDGS